MDNLRAIKGLTTVALDERSLVSALTGNSHLFVFSYSPAYKSLVSWSNNAEEILGVKDVTIARDANLFLRHVHPDDRFLLLTELERALRGEIPYRATYRWIRPDNDEVRWIHCRASITASHPERLFEGVLLDLSHELTGAVGKFAGPDSVNVILATFPIMVFTLDRDLRLVRVNRPKHITATNFGDPGFRIETFRVGRPLLDCFMDQNQRGHFESIMLRILEGALPAYRTRIFYENKVQNIEILPLAEAGAIDGLMCMVSDVSEVVRLENELAELHKSEGLKLLAAGVSHHFNNSLQSIIGQATVINSHPDNRELVVKSSQAIIDVVNKNAELTKQLFVAEDAQRASIGPVDANLAVMAAANRIDDLFSSGFKIGVVFGNVSKVAARQAELVDTIEAVLRNAKESMAARGSDQGSISIKTYGVTLRDLEVSDLRAGSYVKVSIADSGQGMESETKRRCFEPFFTTKEHDSYTGVSLKGSGLGLSKAFAVIREFGGALTVESQSGLGTTLSLYLPAIIEAGDSVRPKAPVQERSSNPDILIVDDDNMVLKTMSTILGEMGFACATAGDYASALGLVRSHQGTLKLVLLDAVMPGMDAAALLKRIKKVRKELVVIGFSGAARDQTQPLLDAGALKILRKPIDPRHLQEIVKSILSTRVAA